MARRMIEIVTCDKCGGVSEFEKFDNSALTARLEPLTFWLKKLGWYVETEGLRTVDICPRCHVEMMNVAGKRKPKKQKATQ